MTNQIAVIDPFVKSPAIYCFNSLVDLLKLPLSYHMPSLMGLSSLLSQSQKTQAYIVLGSASHIHEKLSWHAELSDFLITELEQKKPVLGCCFGHQLLCHAFGSQVDYWSDANEKLSGKRTINITQDFWNFKREETFQLGVTHRQVVKKLGPNLKSVGEGLPHDIVIHSSLPFLGTQAHPEASSHFYLNDIKDLSPYETDLLAQDGARFIQRFFRYFDLIP